LLDGASSNDDLILRARDLGYETLALTDHDGLYGSMEFAQAAKSFGIRAITGAEVTLEGGAHVTLLVELPKATTTCAACSPPPTSPASVSSRVRLTTSCRSTPTG
jgi:DNA polymerase III, alpha subunit